MVDRQPKWVDFERFEDDRGALTVAHIDTLGWVAKRAYWISGVPEGALRGRHRHHELTQLFAAVAGTAILEVVSSDGERTTWDLRPDGRGVEVPPGSWRVVSNFSADCVVLVLVDRPYEPEDYDFQPPE